MGAQSLADKTAPEDSANDETRAPAPHHKIVLEGVSYKCNTLTRTPAKGTTIVKYYQCTIVLPSSEGATWVPAQSSKVHHGFKKTLTKNSEHITYTKCKGTLKATVSTFGEKKKIILNQEIHHTAVLIQVGQMVMKRMNVSHC
jgi:hypothetical protein